MEQGSLVVDECGVEDWPAGEPHPHVCGSMYGHIARHNCRCGHTWLPVR